MTTSAPFPSPLPLPPAVEIQGLVKGYGRRNVLEGVDLTVKAGEFLGLVGLNGAGKTTLIKCLLDFCDFDAGSASLFGLPVGEPRAREGLAYLPERFTPPEFLKGSEFLDLLARLQGVVAAPVAREEVLGRLDLDPGVLRRPVREYSKGMAQKLGLAAVLLSNRPLLLLDEPMSGLDPRGRALFKQALLELREKGTTLFFSTHLLADVEHLCDRMAILHRGRVAFLDTPAACRERYHRQDLEQAFLDCVADA
ncbi:MAG: ABC transporter ATP-binding protein [Gammaproteobacteria bacterium]|nr:MAG: ABC transporter ATP-binding protein [Gammaproteobacteria bacterium]